jgi:hypothetical protein
MKKLLCVVFLFMFLTSTAFAELGFRGRPITNNLMMPTGYTLNQNEFIVGIGSIGYGITDNIQIGTNILLFLFQVYNVNLKASFIKTEKMAFAAGIELAKFNLDVFVDDDDNADFTTISPFVVLSTKMGEKTTLHVAGVYTAWSGDYETDEVDVTSTTSGTRVYGGVDHNLSIKTKFLAEAGYDIEFEGFFAGGGVLFGWEKFRLKLGVTYYSPEGSDGFTLPNIGIWWRFKA